ncbi:hypothetical protein D3C85_1719130 [compost metagenome]
MPIAQYTEDGTQQYREEYAVPAGSCQRCAEFRRLSFRTLWQCRMVHTELREQHQSISDVDDSGNQEGKRRFS